MNEIVQGSPEWFAIRCGKVTASRVADIMAKTKTGPAASRANYMGELIAERLTGATSPSFSNAAMQWGTDHESDARAAYEFRFDKTVAEVGFAIHPTIAQAGCSPDGIVDDDGLCEIKCPNTSTHIETLLGQAVPSKYMAQIQWQLACTDRYWCDFISYDPRLPELMQLFVYRVRRDDKYIAEMEAAVREFLTELDGKVEALLKLHGGTSMVAA